MKPPTSDFLSEKEIEDLQDFERISKKAIQKTDEISEEIPKPKKKPIKKNIEKEKLIKTVKSSVTKPVTHKIINEMENVPIELTIKTVVKYDLNWFYVKNKFIGFKKRLFTPYTIYSNWFNKTFNTKTVIKNIEVYDNISDKWIDLEAIQEFRIVEE